MVVLQGAGTVWCKISLAGRTVLCKDVFKKIYSTSIGLRCTEVLIIHLGEGYITGWRVGFKVASETTGLFIDMKQLQIRK
jgi:hypothetical protein